MQSRKKRNEEIEIKELSDDENDNIGDKNEDTYKIQSHSTSELAALNGFFNSDPKMINPPHTASTNIVDLMNKVNSCFNIPDNKINKFMQLIENCRKKSIVMRISEKQKDPSGIVLDFDIYQDKDYSQLNLEILQNLVSGLVGLLTQMLKMPNAKDSIVVGITTKPKVKYQEEEKYYKDGIHILIPGVKVSKLFKKLFIKKIIETELLEQVLSDVEPTSKVNGKKYTRTDYLDTNSAHIPVFFLGSLTSFKKTAKAYSLKYVFNVTYNGKLENKINVADISSSFLSNPENNLCHEFSVNWEGKTIKKQVYAPKDDCMLEINKISNEINKEFGEETAKNFGEVSMYSIHDVYYREVKELLDILNVRRSIQYTEWFDVLCILANLSPSYKSLGEYFSRKAGESFDLAGFEENWDKAIRYKYKKNSNMGELHNLAKLDNEPRYRQVISQFVQNMINEMIYEPYKQGQLGHSDVAKILHQVLKHKYVVDEVNKKKHWFKFITENDQHIPGEIYKWVDQGPDMPSCISIFMSDNLDKIFKDVLLRVKKRIDENTGDVAKFYNKVYTNLIKTMQFLSDRRFKVNVIKEAEDRFRQKGFCATLDKDPYVRGCANGILKLSTNGIDPPKLITGHHSYKVMRHTKTEYIHFDPEHPKTKMILIKLRELFPNNETDSFEYFMYMMSTTLDMSPKDSIFTMLVSNGSSGKSLLMELLKGTLGDDYSQKMPLTYLTTKSHNADGPTPAVMLLRYASFVYYSESSKNEVLQTNKIKEATGLESLVGRGMGENYINFKPTCHHIVTTNHDFVVEENDWGTWRRLIYYIMKIRFVDINKHVYNPNNPNERIADLSILKKWPADPEICGRFFGILAWYHYRLHALYEGNLSLVPCEHIRYDTDQYRRRQDFISEFIAHKVVKVGDANKMYPLDTELLKFTKWYQTVHGKIITMKNAEPLFKNSEIQSSIVETSRGLYLKGLRFLQNDEKLGEGDKYYVEKVANFTIMNNFGVAVETPEQTYERILAEYTVVKDVYNGSVKIDADDLQFEHLAKKLEQIDEPIKQKNASHYATWKNEILQKGLRQVEIPEPNIDMLDQDNEDICDDFTDNLINDLEEGRKKHNPDDLTAITQPIEIDYEVIDKPKEVIDKPKNTNSDSDESEEETEEETKPKSTDSESEEESDKETNDSKVSKPKSTDSESEEESEEEEEEEEDESESEEEEVSEISNKILVTETQKRKNNIKIT